jgi:lipoprotein-anchoring transpeptidase ErfK/SrfK
MRISRLFLVAMFLIMGAPMVQAAQVVAKIDISEQKMKVYVGGVKRYTWPVSTGRKGYHTPRGSYRPTRMHKMWYSRKYNNSPMPYSIFYKGGYAVHGTNYVSRLGAPASHGCTRLENKNAKTLYNLVRKYGSKNTQIINVN